MHLELEPCDVRSLRPEDAESLAVHAKGIMRRSAIKDGKIIDKFLYAFVVSRE